MAIGITADASHQMRTPLAALRMHLALLRGMDASALDRQATLDGVEGATRWLEHLLEQLIGLARADEQLEDAQVSLAPMDLAGLRVNVVPERVPQAVPASRWPSGSKALRWD